MIIIIQALKKERKQWLREVKYFSKVTQMLSVVSTRICTWIAWLLSTISFLISMLKPHATFIITLSSVSSVAQSCPTLCNPMDCSTPGLPVHHQLDTQTHIHWLSDAIQPSHPLSSPSPSAFSLSQRQGLFRWVNFSYQVAKVLEFQLQHQSFQWIFRTDIL